MPSQIPGRPHFAMTKSLEHLQARFGLCLTTSRGGSPSSKEIRECNKMYTSSHNIISTVNTRVKKQGNMCKYSSYQRNTKSGKECEE